MRVLLHHFLKPIFDSYVFAFNAQRIYYGITINYLELYSKILLKIQLLAVRRCNAKLQCILSSALFTVAILFRGRRRFWSAA